MAGPKRGFSKEKHGTLKAVLTAVSLAGFAVAWLGFSAAHPDAAPEDLVLASPEGTPAQATPTPAATRTATTPRTPVSGTPTPTATDTSDPPEPLPTFARPKRSRGS